MSKAKTKKKVFKDVTLAQAQEASNTYAAKKNQLSQIEAEMNERLNDIKSEYADDINQLQSELEEPVAILQAYATEQIPEGSKKKSIDLLHSVIGFRTGTPKVNKSKSFTWDAVLELIKKNKMFKSFIRPKEEINKEAILAEKNKELLKALKEEAYVFIDQDETFYITPKVEEVITA